MNDLLHPAVRESRPAQLGGLREMVPLPSLLRKDVASIRPTWLPVVLVLAAIAGVAYVDHLVVSLSILRDLGLVSRPLHIHSSPFGSCSPSETRCQRFRQSSNALDSSPLVIRHLISGSPSKRLCFQALPEMRARFSQWHPGCTV